MMMRKNPSAKNQLDVSDYEDRLVEKRLEFLPEEYARSNEMKAAVHDAIETLPPQRREAVYLYYYSDMKQTEIAESMGISPESVPSMLAKARKNIKKALEDREGRKLARVRAFVFMPVLTRVFDYRARGVVTDAQVQGFIARCRVMLEAAPHAAPAGAEEDEARPGGPGQSAPTASAPRPAGRAVQNIATPVSGAVVLKDNDGNIMAGGGFLNGITESLIDSDNAVVQSTTADGGGAFAFSPVYIAYETEYALEAALPESGALAATPDNPYGRTLVRLTPGRGVSDAALYVTYTRAPDGSVTFLGGDCACGHVNPDSIVIDAGAYMTEQAWEIWNEDGGVVAAGTGAVIAPELQPLADGTYTVRYIHTNSIGSSEEIKKDFIIYSGPVTPDKFA
jgi:predicted DNA-binding protein (UPF0251 family)